MEQKILFNGVVVVLTTGSTLDEVQNFFDEAEVIVSVYADEVKILRGPSES